MTVRSWISWCLQAVVVGGIWLAATASQAQSSKCPIKSGHSFRATVKITATIKGKPYTAEVTLNRAIPSGMRKSGSQSIAQLPIVQTTIPKDRKYTFNFVPSIIIKNADRADCTLSFQAAFNNRNWGGSQSQTQFNIQIQSTVNGRTYSTSESMYTSCLHEDTQITMADGAKVPIKNLVVGEWVYNPITRKKMRIKLITRGEEEEPLYEIGHGSFSALFTAKHPIVTRHGLKQARQIRADTQILGADGKYHRVSLLKTHPPLTKGYVYNLYLDTPSTAPRDHYFLANGLVVGDMYLQHRLDK